MPVAKNHVILCEEAVCQLGSTLELPRPLAGRGVLHRWHLQHPESCLLDMSLLAYHRRPEGISRSFQPAIEQSS